MLTRRVVPTCLISPTRPMIVNSAIVFMASFLFPSPRAFGSCRRSLGCGSREVGRAGPAPARHERAEALSEGRRRAAILSREEFGLQAEGENRRTRAVAARLVRRHGRPENPRDRTGMARSPAIPVLMRSWLALSFIAVCSYSAKPYILC